jgi:hypothetical protein
MRYQAIIIVEFTDEDVAAGCGDPLGEANEIVSTLMGALDCNMWLDDVVELEEKQ